MQSRKTTLCNYGSGNNVSDDFGYEYVKGLAQNYYGIEAVSIIKAEGLYIIGAYVEDILKSTEKEISN